jgi:hypothetical protein
MQSSSFVRFVVSGVFVPVVAAGATGCAGRLTPDEVRALLDEPKGTVSALTLPTITRDLFVADRAASVENLANVLKSEQSSGNEGGGDDGGDEGAVEAVGDTWCVGSLVAAIASFDGCQSGDSCKAELTLDSCVLRVGDPGLDEDANGSIQFKLDNTVDDDVARTALSLEFRGWESSRDDDTLNAIDGLMALDTVINDAEDTAEVVVAADLDARVRNKERGFLDDGYVEQAHLMAGARFLGESTDTSASGTLEVLALLDEDGARTESVVIRLAAEGRTLDAEEATASAALEVVGENGTFRCTWSATSQEGDRDGVRVASAGECIDENGESFSFEGEAVSRD